ncbi:MAG TPA: hypothetical protein VFT22_42415 [Kofleriaceae bacterium]|nr:hypothetical protein [Kofleriaceae bacterium]
MCFAAVATIVDHEAGADDATPDLPGSSDPDDVDAVRKAANDALSHGEFARARSLYEVVARIDHRDARAVREAGRAALALGDLGYGVDALKRADDLARHEPDPELHYLRGEALYALGQPDQARREQALVVRQLRDVQPTRQSQLWLARVYARRGELARSDRLYRSLAPSADQPVDVEVALGHAESHVLAHDWRGAQGILRELLVRAPENQRARELLAASLEGSGDLNGELAVRAALARDATTSRRVLDYGRALERSGDYAAALRAYRRARTLGGAAQRTDPELTSALARMSQRTSVEVVAAAQGRSDPLATSLGEQAGIAVPFGAAHHLAWGAWRESLTGQVMARDGMAGELWSAIALHYRPADVVAGGKLGIRDLRAEDGSSDRGASWSGFVNLRARPVRDLELALDAEVNALWRETPYTLLEGGRVTGATLHVFHSALDRRLVVDSGAQGRRLVLPGLGGGRDPTTSQLLAWTGVDFVLWSDFEHALDGEVLDDNLLPATYLADSVVAGYRHFELFSGAQDAFMRRLSLVDRSSIEEATLTARKVVASNRVGAELRGVLGWDHARGVAISRIGVSLLAVPMRSSRISLNVDVGVESPSGFKGQTRTGSVSYHADL